MIDLLEEDLRVYEVEDWKIPQLWDEKEIKWISKDKIIVQQRAFKVIHGAAPQKNMTIIHPVPLSPDWHRLTNWRSAEELYKNYLPYWKEWKRKSIIPYWVIEKVEGEEGNE